MLGGALLSALIEKQTANKTNLRLTLVLTSSHMETRGVVERQYAFVSLTLTFLCSRGFTGETEQPATLSRGLVSTSESQRVQVLMPKN